MELNLGVAKNEIYSRGGRKNSFHATPINDFVHVCANRGKWAHNAKWMGWCRIGLSEELFDDSDKSSNQLQQATFEYLNGYQQLTLIT
jgi:hypothetical protein